jgi:hypothetical protein
MIRVSERVIVGSVVVMQMTERSDITQGTPAQVQSKEGLMEGYKEDKAES